MKRPQPDIGALQQQRFLINVSTIKKMLRLWGTTTVDGVEVFNKRQYFVPSAARSENFEKLFKYLGAYESALDTDYHGIKEAWLFLNRNKSSTLKSSEYPNGVPEFVTSNLNLMWWDPADGAMPSGLTLTTTVVVEDDKYLAAANPGLATAGSIIAQPLSKEQLKTTVVTSFDDLWLTSRVTHQGIGVINKGSITDPNTKVVTQDEDDLTPDDPWLAAATRYALRSSGVTCTVKDVTIGLANVGDNASGQVANTLVITIEIPYIAFTQASSIVLAISSDIGATYFTPTSATWTSRYNTTNSVGNGYITQKAIQAMDKSDLNDDPELVSRPYVLWEDVSDAVFNLGNYDSLWYNGYLRAAPFRDPRAYGFKFKELAEYLLTRVDSDVRKKKVSTWKKVVAIIIFIVAVVLTYLSSGLASPLLKAATAILVGVLILTLITLAFSAMGQADWASAFAEANKTVEPLVTIATIILIFTGGVQDYVINYLKAEAASYVMEEVAQEFFGDEVAAVLGAAAGMYAGSLNNTSAVEQSSTLKALKRATKLVELTLKLKLASIVDRNKDLQAEYSKLQEEAYQENDALQGFMNIYAKPATADWSMYASLYDLPYERAGGRLALGNIQRTTKQALRKANYDDPAFENIVGL